MGAVGATAIVAVAHKAVFTLVIAASAMLVGGGIDAGTVAEDFSLRAGIFFDIGVAFIGAIGVLVGVCVAGVRIRLRTSVITWLTDLARRRVGVEGRLAIEDAKSLGADSSVKAILIVIAAHVLKARLVDAACEGQDDQGRCVE